MSAETWRKAPKRRKDRRYGTRRWRWYSDHVLGKSKHQRLPRYECWRPGCHRTATVADHIRPVYPGMPDHEFYSLANLRPSCDPCNRARGLIGDAAWGEEPDSKPVRRTIFSGPPRIG